MCLYVCATARRMTAIKMLVSNLMRNDEVLICKQRYTSLLLHTHTHTYTHTRAHACHVCEDRLSSNCSYKLRHLYVSLCLICSTHSHEITFNGFRTLLLAWRVACWCHICIYMYILCAACVNSYKQSTAEFVYMRDYIVLTFSCFLLF